MKPENAIEVHEVKKSFKVYLDKGNMLRERVIHLSRNRYERREVLKGVSFDVKTGEAVGIIGRNGCGKSTTLKLLTRILRPNGGSIEMRGRVCSLIELGAGFHPDMSGRENIYINASIFGIKKKEIDRRLEDIIRFSELEGYIDNPIRTYSSGMYMRLAFSVAINVDADILLIDEILAVGDSAFQAKCFRKLRDLKKNGTTIVLVSHSLDQVEELCDRALWIDEGLIRMEGPSRQVCREYLDYMETVRRKRADQERMQNDAKQGGSGREQAQTPGAAGWKNTSCQDIALQCGPDAHRSGTGEARFTDVALLNADGNMSLRFNTGDSMTVSMKYRSEIPGEPLNFVVCITRSDWVFCYGCEFKTKNGDYCSAKEAGAVEYTIEKLALLEGKYFMDVRIQKPDQEGCDVIYSLFEFEVKTPKPSDAGILWLDCKWKEETPQ